MANTVNFTSAVDPALLQRAKVVAAKASTSVNALFNAELRYLVETFESAERAQNQNYSALLAFSLGRSDDQATQAALGIDGDEALFLLMAQARLPMPRLSAATTEAMVESLLVLPHS